MHATDDDWSFCAHVNQLQLKLRLIEKKIKSFFFARDALHNFSAAIPASRGWRCERKINCEIDFCLRLRSSLIASLFCYQKRLTIERIAWWLVIFIVTLLVAGSGTYDLLLWSVICRFIMWELSLLTLHCLRQFISSSNISWKGFHWINFRGASSSDVVNL